jgi:glycosyltransferase involved in cell wall biosynthesis
MDGAKGISILVSVAPISVIIPAYNRSKTIRECLDSIRDQTLQPLEVLVVDDCSQDDTIKIVTDYGNPLVRLLKLTENSGAQKARNTGIKAAKGEWIAFLDSDDTWVPEYLEEQYQLVLRSGALVAYSGAFIDDGNTRKVYTMPDYSGETYQKILQKPGPMFQGLLVHKSCLESIGYLDEKVPAYQEWETSIRLASKNNFVFNPKPLFVYHLHSGETISKNKKNDVLGYRYIIEKHEGEIKRIAGDVAFYQHLRVIQQKNFNNGNWVGWREISLDMLVEHDSIFVNKLLKKLLIYTSPRFYHRFQDYISPLFLMQRLNISIRKKLTT